MDSFIGKLRKTLHRLTEATPPRRRASPDTDWLPPMVAVSDLSSPYFLAMADREAAWYFDRR